MLLISTIFSERWRRILPRSDPNSYERADFRNHICLLADEVGHLSSDFFVLESKVKTDLLPRNGLSLMHLTSRKVEGSEQH